MKFLYIAILLFISPVIYTYQVNAQSHTENIRKTFNITAPSSKKLVSIQNLRGAVTVEAYNGNEVVFEIEETITASTEAGVAIGKKEVSLIFEERTDTLIAYILSPNARWRGYRYGAIHFSGDEDEFSFEFNMKVKVPEQISLDVFTNKGQVIIANVKGNIKAYGHNGLTLISISGKTEASAHHGDLEASYTTPIPASSSFRSHHGDIKITLPSPPDADITFDSYHGAFYTDFADVKALPLQVNKKTSTDGESKNYKLEQKKAIRLGKGGITLQFKSHHGSFYLLSKK